MELPQPTAAGLIAYLIIGASELLWAPTHAALGTLQ